jgi:hypothetical protein
MFIVQATELGGPKSFLHHQQSAPIVVSFYQDFVANMQSNLFHKYIEKGLVYCPNRGSLTEGEI